VLQSVQYYLGEHDYSDLQLPGFFFSLFQSMQRQYLQTVSWLTENTESTYPYITRHQDNRPVPYTQQQHITTSQAITAVGHKGILNTLRLTMWHVVAKTCHQYFFTNSITGPSRHLWSTSYLIRTLQISSTEKLSFHLSLVIYNISVSFRQNYHFDILLQRGRNRK
jgi:hypothetical protein